MNKNQKPLSLKIHDKLDSILIHLIHYKSLKNSNTDARHSFGNICNKISLKILQKLYNHSDIQTTIQYQQSFMNTEIDEALDTVINF